MNTGSIISGFADEVSDDLSLQIKALKSLGWQHIDLRSIDGKNVSSLTADEFKKAHQQLAENNINIACFGSTIANWGRIAGDSFALDKAEMQNSIRYMHAADVRFIRIMSYKIDGPVRLDSDLESIIIRNIRELVKIAEDNDVICLHENCETWGGQSCKHSLRLLEQVNSPALKLVFDTGNPVFMKHIDGIEPYPYQDSLHFFQQVRDHVAYLHIKDGLMHNGSARYTFPGKGAGRVREILKLVSENDMAIPISIEPHISVVFHDPSVKASPEERWTNFIEYGKQLVTLAEEAGIIFSKSTSL